MNILMSVSKAVLLHLVKKYAAELLFDVLIKTLRTAANKTETTFDNEVVDKVLKEKDTILTIIKAG